MIIQDIKNYIKEEKTASLTDLSLRFDLDYDELEAPLDFLCNKGYIKAELPIVNTNNGSKCSGCTMGCKPKEQENCHPAPAFIIYKWNDN